MKNEKGITLIALVITVIVLLILAGAAVSIGLSSDGIFAKANEAKTEWNGKVGQEETDLNQYIDMIDDTITLNKLLEFIENDDVCWDRWETEFTEKLKYMGSYDYGTGWSEARGYRCSIDDNIYIVGTKEGKDEIEMEQVHWDGTVTLYNDGKPALLSTPYGDFQFDTNGNASNHSGSTHYAEDTNQWYMFVYPSFTNYLILQYSIDGKVIDIQWMD